MGEIFDKIYKEVQKIPRGKTVTYGEIARRVNVTPRVVGFALHANPDPKNIPCHRVVFRDGSCSSGFAFGGKKAQEKMLKEEQQNINK